MCKVTVQNSFEPRTKCYQKEVTIKAWIKLVNILQDMCNNEYNVEQQLKNINWINIYRKIKWSLTPQTPIIFSNFHALTGGLTMMRWDHSMKIFPYYFTLRRLIVFEQGRWNYASESTLQRWTFTEHSRGITQFAFK